VLSGQSVAERVPAGRVVGEFRAVDPGAASGLSYQLVDGPGADDNRLFAVVDGRLQTTATLDRQARPTCRVRVRASDALGRRQEKSFEVFTARRITLDTDANATADALSDGILMLRYLFDPGGAWSVNDALGASAARTTRAAIKEFLDACRTTALDADGNGTADALSDGILILRYLFDPAGAWTVSDALGQGAMRTTREAIRAYLDQFTHWVAASPPSVPASADATAERLAPLRAVGWIGVDADRRDTLAADELFAADSTEWRPEAPVEFPW
jgi:hypothetical protein